MFQNQPREGEAHLQVASTRKLNWTQSVVVKAEWNKSVVQCAEVTLKPLFLKEQQSLLLFLLPQGRPRGPNGFVDPRSVSLFTLSLKLTVLLFHLALQMSICVAKTFFPHRHRRKGETRAQAPVLEIIVLDPEEATGHCTMNRPRECWPVDSVCVNRLKV